MAVILALNAAAYGSAGLGRPQVRLMFPCYRRPCLRPSTAKAVLDGVDLELSGEGITSRPRPQRGGQDGVAAAARWPSASRAGPP